MKHRLLEALPEHVDCLQTLHAAHLYIVDWKDENDGGITFEATDSGRPAVVLHNPAELLVCCDKFGENALPIKKGQYCSQCECVVFPDMEDTHNWVLFIEMKYAKDIFKARDPRNGYPRKMVDQIMKTVEYFRRKQILSERKFVHAIVAFPFLDHFNAWFDQNLVNEALSHRILVRATNKARIASNSQLLLLG